MYPDPILFDHHSETKMLRKLTPHLSKRVSLRTVGHEEHTVFRDKRSLEELQPAILQSPSSVDRARKARERQQKREQFVTRAREARRAAVLQSLDNFDDSQEFDESSKTLVKAIHVARAKDPCRWRRSQCGDVEGDIVPSDQAYVDMILEKGSSLRPGSALADFVTMDSKTEKVPMDSVQSLSFLNSHTVAYRGEPIWKLETKSTCDMRGTAGQSSSCVLNKHRARLRVKITHKGRMNLGEGWNTREIREYKLEDMVKQSGEARERELFA